MPCSQTFRLCTFRFNIDNINGWELFLVAFALRGRYEPGDNKNEEGETDSNFAQLLKMCAEDISSLFNWIKNLRPNSQAQIYKMSIMALMILREITSEIAGKWYTIMVNETTDLSNSEQMVLCLTL